MAVKSTTYGTVSKVEARIGDLADDRTFTTSTVPTKAEIEEFLDDVGDEINAVLNSSGYSPPISETDYSYAYWFLVAINSDGAAATAISTLPAAAITDPDSPPSAIQGRQQFYQRRFEKGLETIRKRQLRAGAETMRLMLIGSEKDSDGNTKKPLFTRGMTDYPGSRSLVEE